MKHEIPDKIKARLEKLSRPRLREYSTRNCTRRDKLKIDEIKTKSINEILREEQ